MRLVGFGAKAAVTVDLVVLVVALEPDDLAVAFERQDVGRDPVRNQRSWLITTAQPANDSSASSSARSVSTSRSFVGSSSSRRFAPLEELCEVDPVALAAREMADLALLVAPLKLNHET